MLGLLSMYHRNCQHSGGHLERCEKLQVEEQGRHTCVLAAEVKLKLAIMPSWELIPEPVQAEEKGMMQ